MTPHQILGVPESASEEELRNAYLAKVKEFPPDRAPEEFERIRNAWDELRNPRARALARFLSVDYSGPMVRMVDRRKLRRIFVGPKPWREVLRSK